MSGVQHPCHVLYYLHKWLNSSDGVFIWVLNVSEMVQKNLVYVSFGACSTKKK